MNPRMLFLAPLVAALLGAGCSNETAAPGSGAAVTFPEDPYATQASDSGKLTLAVRTAPDQPPERGLATVELLISDEAGDPADDLVITALPWMPDMGHGTSVKPTVKNDGGGRYEVTNVNLFMAGRWELRLTITGPLDDSAKIPFQIP